LRGRTAVARRHAELAQVDIDAATKLLASVHGYALEEANLEALRISVLAQRPGARGEADRKRDELMALMRSEDLADTPTFAGLLVDRAQERAFANDYAGVRADMAQALTIARARFGPVSPQALQTERDMVFYSLRGSNGTGDADTDRVLAAQHQTVAQSFGEKSLEFSDVLVFEGIVAGERDDMALARKYFEQSLAIVREHLGPDADQVALGSHNLGDAEIATGNPARALELYTDALRIRLLHNAAGDDEPTTINRLQIARAECQLGQYQSANSGFTDARKRLAERLAPTHAYLVVAASLQVDCLLRQHDTAAARALFDAEMTAPRREGLSRNDRDRVAATEQALVSAEKATNH